MSGPDRTIIIIIIVVVVVVVVAAVANVLRYKQAAWRRCSTLKFLFQSCPVLFSVGTPGIQAVVRVPDYRSRGPGSIPGATKFL
jgi:hypothetical protein